MGYLAADAKMIGAWAATLCTESDTIPEDMVVSLGFWGTMDRQGGRYEIQPAPEGTKGVWITLRGENFDGLEVEMESAVPADTLDRYLGEATEVAPGQMAYRCTAPNAPNVCIVVVHTNGELVKRLTMRRKPVLPTRRPGFPLPLDEFLERAKAMGSRGELTTLKLSGAGGRVAELARVPELANVVTLVMRNQGITDADIQALVASPYVHRLRLLSVEQNEIGDEGVEALAAAASTTLRSLGAVGLDLNHVRSPADQLEFYNETQQERVPTEAGKLLEEKYGPILWLHPGNE